MTLPATGPCCYRAEQTPWCFWTYFRAWTRAELKVPCLLLFPPALPFPGPQCSCVESFGARLWLFRGLSTGTSHPKEDLPLPSTTPPLRPVVLLTVTDSRSKEKRPPGVGQFSLPLLGRWHLCSLSAGFFPRGPTWPLDDPPGWQHPVAFGRGVLSLMASVPRCEAPAARGGRAAALSGALLGETNTAVFIPEITHPDNLLTRGNASQLGSQGEPRRLS